MIKAKACFHDNDHHVQLIVAVQVQQNKPLGHNKRRCIPLGVVFQNEKNEVILLYKILFSAMNILSEVYRSCCY